VSAMGLEARRAESGPGMVREVDMTIPGRAMMRFVTFTTHNLVLVILEPGYIDDGSRWLA